MTVRSTPQQHRHLRIQRRLHPAPPPENSPGTPCIEHEYRPATRVIRGIGPLCGPCIADLPGDSAHRRRLVPRRCGCHGYVMCAYARALYTRATKAHRLMVSTPEGDPRVERLAHAYTQMMLALRSHRELDR